MWGTPKSVNKIFRTLVLLWTFETIQHIYFYLSYHLPWLISMHPLWEYCICRYLYTALLKSVLCSSSTRSILLPTEKKKKPISPTVSQTELSLLCLSRLCSWLPFFLPHPPDSILPRFAANAMVDPYFPHYVLLANEPDHTQSCTLYVCSSTKPSLEVHVPCGYSLKCLPNTH